MVAQYEFLDHAEKIQSAYSILNFTFNIFALRDRFHIHNGLRDIWV